MIKKTTLADIPPFFLIVKTVKTVKGVDAVCSLSGAYCFQILCVWKVSKTILHCFGNSAVLFGK